MLRKILKKIIHCSRINLTFLAQLNTVKISKQVTSFFNTSVKQFNHKVINLICDALTKFMSVYGYSMKVKYYSLKRKFIFNITFENDMSKLFA